MSIRDLFPGYFRPTEAEFRKMWDEGIVAVDANILLHVYRYSPRLTDALYKVMEKLGARLWAPHRVVQEFSKNRLKVIAGQEKAYDQACSGLDKVSDLLKRELPSRHPTIDADGIRKRFSALIDTTRAELQRQKTEHPKTPEEDPAVARLSALLEGKIGEPLSADEMKAIPDDGEKRYKAKIPPGFRDTAKDDDPLHKYGDLVVWRQLLRHAKSSGARYVIFATDDSSEDWWWQQDGKTVGPHPALVEEASVEANCRVHIYSGDQFIRFASEHFRLGTDQSLIREAATVRKDLERRHSRPLRYSLRRVRAALASLGRLHEPSVIDAVARSVYRYHDSAIARRRYANYREVFDLPSAELILSRSTSHEHVAFGEALLERMLRERQSKTLAMSAEDLPERERRKAVEDVTQASAPPNRSKQRPS